VGSGISRATLSMSPDGRPRRRSASLAEVQTCAGQVFDYLEGGGIVQLMRGDRVIGYAISREMGESVWAGAADPEGDWERVAVTHVRREQRRRPGDSAMTGAEMRALGRMMYGIAWQAGIAAALRMSVLGVRRMVDSPQVPRKVSKAVRAAAAAAGIDWRAVTG